MGRHYKTNVIYAVLIRLREVRIDREISPYANYHNFMPINLRDTLAQFAKLRVIHAPRALSLPITARVVSLKATKKSAPSAKYREFARRLAFSATTCAYVHNLVRFC